MSITVLLLAYFVVIYNIAYYTHTTEQNKIKELEQKISKIISRKNIAEKKLDNISNRIENIVYDKT